MRLKFRGATYLEVYSNDTHTLRDPPRAHGVDMDISFWLMEAFSAFVSLLVAVSLRHR